MNDTRGFWAQLEELRDRAAGAEDRQGPEDLEHVAAKLSALAARFRHRAYLLRRSAAEKQGHA